MADDLASLKRKAEAGAHRILTQFFLDTESFLKYRDNVVDLGVDIPVIPGIIPIANFQGLVQFAGKCGASVPKALFDRFAGVEPDSDAHRATALDVAQEQCET